MTLKVGMQHRVLEYYQVCSNGDPWLALTYFKARSNLVPYAFVWEKGKTMDFSETIVVCDIKVGRCSQLNEYMNFYDYQRSNVFSLETTSSIEAKFYVEPPWNRGRKVSTNSLCHMDFSGTIVVCDIKVVRCSKCVHEPIWKSKVKVIHWPWSKVT